MEGAKDGCMDRLVEGGRVKCFDGWVDGLMDGRGGQMDGWMAGGIYGWMDTQMDGERDGHTERWMEVGNDEWVGGLVNG